MRGPGTSPRAIALLHVHVRVHRAFRLHVANRSKTVFKRDACIARRENRAIRSGLFQELLVVICRRDVPVQKHVRVHVDESGQHRRFREIDELIAGRWRSSGGNRNNFVAFDENQGVEDRRVALAVNQTSGANGDFLCGRLCPFPAPELQNKSKASVLRQSLSARPVCIAGSWQSPQWACRLHAQRAQRVAQMGAHLTGGEKSEVGKLRR